MLTTWATNATLISLTAVVVVNTKCADSAPMAVPGVNVTLNVHRPPAVTNEQSLVCEKLAASFPRIWNSAPKPMSPSPVFVTTSGSVTAAESAALVPKSSVEVDNVAVACGLLAAAAWSTEMSCQAVHFLLTASLAMQNRRFSMFHRASTPSPPENPLTTP